jgi:hypothetical protein
MSFDSSRFTFDPWNDFFGVVMEQGRVQLDSDWNEWLAELARRIQAGTLDTFGRAVAPRTTPHGFEITFAPGDVSFTIGPGRMYVDGLLAQNHGLPAPNPQKWIPAVTATPVPPSFSTFTGATLSPGWDSALDEQVGLTGVAYERQPYYPNPAPFPQSGGPYLVYLDVWRREVTFLEDPDLIEKAVGVDTTGRLQTVWQVKWVDAGAGATCGSDIPAWDNLLLPPGARLTTGVAQSTPSGPCCLTANSGFTGLENQLYRVEIHQGGSLATATFKWSRDNASVATRVLGIAQGGTVLGVESTGRDNVLGFAANDWVEITDDWLELNGLPGELHQVAFVNTGGKTVTLTTPVSPANFPVDSNGQTLPRRHTRLTRWDGTGTAGDTPVSTSPVTLENGITVTFGLAANAQSFKSGDYWVFAARSTDGTVEFLDAAPPRGIYHHYARLAVVGLSSASLSGSSSLTNRIGIVTLQDQSQPPVSFLTFTATNPSGWPANFFVVARANALSPRNFDLEIVYDPPQAQSVTLPVVVEAFSNLSINPSDSNFAPAVLAASKFVAVPSSYTPPSQAPVLSAAFPTPSISLASQSLQLIDNNSAAFLTLQATSALNWPSNFSVSASPAANAGSLNLAVIYSATGGDSFATLELFSNLSLSNLAANSVFIGRLTALITASTPLTLIGASDCRVLWPPQPTSNAIHVTATNWSNDQTLPLGQFMQGLQVTLDAPPDALSVTSATVVVALENEPAGAAGPATPEILTFLGGPAPTVSGANIVWVPNPQLPLPQLSSQGARIRVTLKGHCIWNSSSGTLRYLDGQAFGTPQGTHIALDFPSGNGARASDFESWFTVAPTPPLTAVLNTPVPVILRAAGLTEAVSDLVLTFTGGIPTAAGAPVPVVNISVALNTSMTSRLFSSLQPVLQDAVLLIDDPLVLNTTPGAPTGIGGNGLNFNRGQAPNIFIGQPPVTGGSNSVTFFGVPIDPPGASTRTFRITNIRANASQLSGSSTVGNTNVQASVAISGASVPALTNPIQVVGTTQLAITTQVTSLSGTTSPTGLFTINPSTGVNTGLAANPASNTGLVDILLHFQGSFAGAFKPLTVSPVPAIGSPHLGEATFNGSGLPLAPGAPPIPATEPIGQTDQGTLLVALFQNIPVGVQIFVTTRDLPPNGITGNNPSQPPPQAVLVTSEGGGGTPPTGVPSGTGGITAGPAPFAGIPIAPVRLANGQGEAVWEWVGAPQPTAIQAIQFGVLLAAPPGTQGVAGAAGPIVRLSLGPRSTDAAASAGDFIPRFVDVSQPTPFFVFQLPSNLG